MIEPDQSPKTDHGHCLCSAVKFTVTGEPLYNVVCHCENCRRHGGSIFHCASIFLRKQYTLHTSPAAITTYTDPATQSGKPLYRAFCSVCGSKIWAKTPWNEEIISVPAGVLDSANQHPQESHSQTESAGEEANRTEREKVAPWRPHKEQFCEMRQAWVPDFGELIGSRFVKGPGGAEVGGLTQKQKQEGTGEGSI